MRSWKDGGQAWRLSCVEDTRWRDGMRMGRGGSVGGLEGVEWNEEGSVGKGNGVLRRVMKGDLEFVI